MSKQDFEFAITLRRIARETPNKTPWPANWLQVFATAMAAESKPLETRLAA